MKEIRFSLLSEGSSDAALLPVIEWTFRQHLPVDCLISGERVDEGRLPIESVEPAERVRLAIDVYPCDFLILHRDEDGAGWDHRANEIYGWVQEADMGNTLPIPVIPIRETESWLLIDEFAIRRAADNPNGTVKLKLPKLSALERTADPKELLFKCLTTASELKGRKLKKFDKLVRRKFVGRYIDDFSKLRALASFEAFEKAVQGAIAESRAFD